VLASRSAELRVASGRRYPARRMARLAVALVGLVMLGGAACAGDTVPEPPLQAAAHSLVGDGQGVFALAGDGTVLASQLADVAVHPASVTKVATSLALLERLGPRYRFETRVFAGGAVRDGQVQGALVVEAGGDPTLVYENAFLLLRKLHALGVRGATGGLAVHGPLLFNWKPDPEGARLRLALAGLDGAPAWAALNALFPAPLRLREVGLTLDGNGPSDGAGMRTLAVLRSPPLVRVLKWLNDYSNNVFHLASARIGGPATVQQVARAHLPPAMRDEVVIDNAAGAGDSNRLSPRAAVELLRALDSELARGGFSLVDALPVSGMDHGTLEERMIDRRGMVVGKTGTFGSVGASALVGMVHTRRWGPVAFAVLNSWLPVPEARRRQDAFVRVLLTEGDGIPWSYRSAGMPPFTDASLE
jgi:D-alanyl-D-alanine carboxypeptidase/D-alanyl-D-alanine-endopeptidase (penicillin-binding protein 4)